MVDTLDLFNTYRVPTQHLVSLLLAAAIWRWGGSPERWLISVFLATMVAPLALVYWLDLGPAETGPYAPIYVMLDLVAAVMFTAVALNANRTYPLWIAGFQLVAVAAHGVRAVVDNISELAFAILVIGPSYCQLLLLIGGFVRHLIRQRRFGPYREWRSPAKAHWPKRAMSGRHPHA